MDEGFVFNRSELDIYTPPKELDPIQSSMEESFLPNTTLDNYGEITFTIPGYQDEWIDLGQSSLSMIVQVVKANGEHIAPDVKREKLPDGKLGSSQEPDISIPNCFFGALIQRMTLTIDKQPIGAGSYAHFPQITLLKTLLTNSRPFADGVLSHGIVWEMDLGNEYREFLNIDRYAYIKGSRPLTLMSPLSNDLFNCSRLIPQMG